MRTSPGPPVYCRLTVLAPRSRLDVALPADVPLAELVPMVLELLGEPRPGRPSDPWRFGGVTGGILPAGSTLDELGVLDGELLRIGPHAPPPVAPVFDDPVDALASTVGTDPVGVVEQRFRAAAVLGVALAGAALLAAFRGIPPDPTVPGVLVAIAVGLGAAGSMAAVARAARLARGPGGGGGFGPDRLGALTAAVAAVLLAAAGGWTALPGAPGAGHLLLAAAAAGTTAAVAQVALRVVAPALIAVVVATTLLGVGALLRLRFGIPVNVLTAAIGALTLAVGPLLPRAALRLAGLPRPLVPSNAGELVAADAGPDVLPATELAERADLARGFLAGLVGGCAAAAAVAVVPTAAAGGWAGPSLGVVTVVVLGLRARGFGDLAPARTLLVAAIGSGLGLVGLVAVQAGPAARLAVALGLVLAAIVGSVVTVRAGRAGPGPSGDYLASPVSRRAVDRLEGVLVAAAVPLALGAMGLYELVRGL